MAGITRFDRSYLAVFASASHLSIKEPFAAPASGLPFLSMPLSAQPDAAGAAALLSASHFFTKDAFATPAAFGTGFYVNNQLPRHH